LVINEVFLSLQGESTFAGLPCIFIRLTACNLRCSYCDTAYAFTEGRRVSLNDIRAEVRRLAASFGNNDMEPHAGQPRASLPLYSGSRNPATQKLPLVEVTGGEPLLQSNCLSLMESLCDEGYTVLIETSGAHDISAIDSRVHRIMDLKCPGSGEVERNRWENIPHLKATDEVKFVISTLEDYQWAVQKVRAYRLDAICPVLFSWVEPQTSGQQDPSLKKVPAGQTPISRRELAERIIADGLPVRFQVQLHKFIWPKDARGV